MMTALEFARELMAPDADAAKVEARDREVSAAALRGATMWFKRLGPPWERAAIVAWLEELGDRMERGEP